MDTLVRLPVFHQTGVNQHSPAEAKIALFRSLFHGREDVYPRRFESRKTGRAGYSPVCGNEWVQGICEKPRIKCSECPHQRFLSVTDDVIRGHLQGHDDHSRDFVIGVYPMLLDETCFFLAADFDKTTWQDDVGALLETCRQMNLPAALERSRSGRGGHIWFFFNEAVPATLARKFGAHILTETMERRPDIGLDSYDRFFPNQDTLPPGGFGNLIALPLQKRPRESGNGVFLDERMTPYLDQWEFLSSINKISRGEVEEVVRRAEAKGKVIDVRLVPEGDEEEATPWMAPPSRRRKDTPIAGPLPKTLELTLANQIYIGKEVLPPALRNRLIRLAAFQNPEFYKAQAMRLSTYDKPRIIACAEDHPKHIGLPRSRLRSDWLQDAASGQRRARLACGRATSHRSRMEEPIRRHRTPIGARWRRFSSGKSICRRSRKASSECRGREPGAKRKRGISISTTGNLGRNERKVSFECGVADSIRWLGSHGG